MYKTLFSTVIAVLIIGCNNSQPEQSGGDASPAAVQARVQRPADGKLLVYPPVPLHPAPESVGAENLLKNSGFEEGDTAWAIENPSGGAYCRNEQYLAEGLCSLQVAPSEKEKIILAQTANLKPRTFYALRALVFTDAQNKVTLQVEDADGNSVVSKREVSGPLQMWTRASLVFLSGVKTSAVTVRIICTGGPGQKPVLIDQCSLQVLPTNNIMAALPVAAPAEDAPMPQWYCQGRPAIAQARGYDGHDAFELPIQRDRAESLAYFVNPEQAPAQSVWFGAIVKAETKDPALDVSLVFRTPAADGEPVEKAVKCPAANDWVETGLLATMPPVPSPDKPVLPPVLLFKRHPAIEGRVFVSDIVMLQVPEGHLDGALLPGSSQANEQ